MEENMKTAKKVLMYTSLATLSVSIILLITAVFGVKVFEGGLLKLLETCATLAIAGFFSINALTMTEKNKTMGYVCLGLLGVLSLCLLIIFWANTKGVFPNLVFVLTIATILFNIIVNLNLKLDKNFLVLQIITYVLIAVIDIILTLLIFGKNVLENSTVLKLFIAGCIVVFGLLCALTILGKKVEKEHPMVVSKEDTASLKNRIKQLEEENAILKEKLSKYENQN